MRWSVFASMGQPWVEVSSPGKAAQIWRKSRIRLKNGEQSLSGWAGFPFSVFEAILRYGTSWKSKFPFVSKASMTKVAFSSKNPAKSLGKMQVKVSTSGLTRLPKFASSAYSSIFARSSIKVRANFDVSDENQAHMPMIFGRFKFDPRPIHFGHNVLENKANAVALTRFSVKNRVSHLEGNSDEKQAHMPMFFGRSKFDLRPIHVASVGAWFNPANGSNVSINVDTIFARSTIKVRANFDEKDENRGICLCFSVDLCSTFVLFASAHAHAP
jgi:hypothetical protein